MLIITFTEIGRPEPLRPEPLRPEPLADIGRQIQNYTSCDTSQHDENSRYLAQTRRVDELERQFVRALDAIRGLTATGESHSKHLANLDCTFSGISRDLASIAAISEQTRRDCEAQLRELRSFIDRLCRTTAEQSKQIVDLRTFVGFLMGCKTPDAPGAPGAPGAPSTNGQAKGTGPLGPLDLQKH